MFGDAVADADRKACKVMTGVDGHLGDIDIGIENKAQTSCVVVIEMEKKHHNKAILQMSIIA